jgi:hypothetical protein
VNPGGRAFLLRTVQALPARRISGTQLAPIRSFAGRVFWTVWLIGPVLLSCASGKIGVGGRLTGAHYAGCWRTGGKAAQLLALSHGAIFFVFMCLSVIVGALTIFGDLDLLKVVTEARIAAETEFPEPEGWLE